MTAFATTAPLPLGKAPESIPITIFAIHGNHEQRPYTIDSYKEKIWHGGTVFYEEEYPSIQFAKDGEIFDLNGKRTVVIGGAYLHVYHDRERAVKEHDRLLHKIIRLEDGLMKGTIGKYAS